MYIGIDLGTSGVKVILMDEAGAIVGSTTQPLTVSNPHPLWSEQNPEQWWHATQTCLDELAKTHNLSAVSAFGLAGQMHGATLLDKKHDILRPAILWNDGRCQKQCDELSEHVPDFADITGNLIMPGFTAPKLKWVAENEPELFDKIDKVLLPKDYLRFCLSGDFASDMSDSAGTCWLNVAKRCWSKTMLSACGLTESHMPKLYEGNEITGYLKTELATRWGMKNVAIAAGGGDNAAGAVGVGITKPGQAMLSLGTSGVYFVVSDDFACNTASAVHSFCHALPNSWHLMSVTLSAASCLQWFANNSGIESVKALLDEAHSVVDETHTSLPFFLPYLTGERTPHNNPNATANFIGISASTTRAHLCLAVVEGVCMALADGMDALHDTGVKASSISLIGGGAQSEFWRQLLADITHQPLNFCQGGEVGPALGAARLAKLAVSPNATIDNTCPEPILIQSHQPTELKRHYYQQRRKKFRQLYGALSAFY